MQAVFIAGGLLALISIPCISNRVGIGAMFQS